jgi:predicted ribosome quality control (RQC) complex YloA/Tae2 family protein
VVNNYYTLLRLSHEFNNLLSGSRILHATTWIKHTLDISLQTRENHVTRLIISCLPTKNFIYAEISTPHKKGANVLPEIVGKEVKVIGITPNERQLFVEFTEHDCLKINLFGSTANIYYNKPDGTMADSFLKPSTNLREKSEPIKKSVNLPLSSDDLRSRFLKLEGRWVDRLPKCIPTVDSTLSREILYRYHLACGKNSPDNISNDDQIDFDLLFRIFSEVKEELLTTYPRIYFSEQDGTPIAFGLIEMRHLQNVRFKRYESVNQCVRDFVVTSAKAKKVIDLKNAALRKLNKRITFLKRTLEKIDSDLKENRADKYHAFGKYLMSHLEDFKQGDTSIHTADENAEIRLDPALNPVQNAQVYFNKAKHARLSIQQAEQRKIQILKELRSVETLLTQTSEKNDNFVTLAGSTASDREFLDSLIEVAKDKNDQPSPFREFKKNGYKIYVGKNAKSNELLTFSFAKPNDVFLHARGVSGSHVIIRNSSREYPQKEVLQFAACIAAYYSKARTSTLVPVAYTMRKFIRKAKGKSGTVVLDREEVLFAKPEINIGEH